MSLIYNLFIAIHFSRKDLYLQTLAHFLASWGPIFQRALPSRWTGLTRTVGRRAGVTGLPSRCLTRRAKHTSFRDTTSESGSHAQSTWSKN